jgi:hypothetical protein
MKQTNKIFNRKYSQSIPVTGKGDLKCGMCNNRIDKENERLVLSLKGIFCEKCWQKEEDKRIIDLFPNNML